MLSIITVKTSNTVVGNFGVHRLRDRVRICTLLG